MNDQSAPRRFIGRVEAERIIALGDVVFSGKDENNQPTTYVVNYGCGKHVIFTANGGTIEIDDHRPGCEHETEAPKQ